MASDSQTTPHRVGTWLAWVQAASTTIIAAIGAYYLWQLNQSQTRLNIAQTESTQGESGISQLKEVRAERESLDGKRIQVYEAVVESLKNNDERMQRVSAALVRAMLEEPLRTELLTVLSEAGTPQVQQETRRVLEQAQIAAFDRAEAEKTVQTAIKSAQRPSGQSGKPYSWGNVDYDIFWCESSGPAAKAIAQGMVELMTSQGAKGRLRVRMLPDSVNSREGYGHHAYIVRYNSGEEAPAKALAAIGNALVGNAGHFAVSLSKQPTPWYLSAFICAPPA